MPQQQQQDVFDQALAEMQTAPAAANAPTPAPSWQQSFEKGFPAQAQAAHQIGQAGQGLMQMAGSVSPLRFREGWDSPTLEMPEAAKAFAHPLNTLASMIGAVKKTVGTTAREAGALVAPNSVQAPSQEDMDQATRSATQFLASLIGPKVLKETGSAIGPAIQGAATKAGIPQLMSEVADTPISRVMGGRPIMRAAARRLYDPPEPPPTPTIDAQFVNSPEAPSPQGEYQDVPSRNIQRTGITAGSQKALAPAPPPGQIAGAPPQAQLGTSMTHPAGLPPAPAEALPVASEGVPIQSDPRLPQAYANQPAAAPTAPPGMMVRGQLRMGETGGIPKTGEQTVTPTQVPMGRHPAGTVVAGEKVGGRIRPMTEAEIQDLVQSRSTAGRTAAETPKPIEKPTPPPKRSK